MGRSRLLHLVALAVDLAERVSVGADDVRGQRSGGLTMATSLAKAACELARLSAKHNARKIDRAFLPTLKRLVEACEVAVADENECCHDGGDYGKAFTVFELDMEQVGAIRAALASISPADRAVIEAWKEAEEWKPAD